MVLLIRTPDDLYRLRRQSGRDEILVETADLKRRNLLRHAVKYGLWALAPGGRLRIVDDGPGGPGTVPGTLPFPFVRQQVFKLTAAAAELEDLDEGRYLIVLRRTAPPQPAAYGAGVLFSGAEREVPMLEAALAGLRAQPELGAARGGTILVCGPAAARRLVPPDIAYLPFETAPGVRIFTTAKKNAIVAALTQPRVVVQHARIVLEAGCLAALPAEFDVVTPQVVYRRGAQTVPYLDWSVLPVLDGERPPSGLPPPVDFDRGAHLAQLRRRGCAYIDGGLFIARRDLVAAVPLNEDLAWGEAEDTEWCARLHHAGALVDLAPEATAVSQTFKLPSRYLDRPRLARWMTPTGRLLRQAGWRS